MKDRVAQIILNILRFFRKHISRKHEHFSYYLLIFVTVIVFVLGINFFVGLTEGVMEKEMKGFDKQVTEYVISFRTPQLNEFFRIVTDIGDFYGYLIATILVAIFFFFKFRNWEFILQLMAVVILAGLSNMVLKEVIERPRPTIDHLVMVESLSYPSGHSMSAMAFYGFLTYLLFHIKMRKRLRAFLSILFVSLIGLIGLSRIYLGVHFPSDVLGGFIAGLIWLAFCVILFNVITIYRKKRARTKPEETEENLEV